MVQETPENKPYYGRDRREGRDRRASRPADKRRSHMILPPPSILENIEQVSPGSVAILMDMAEREQEHRHDWENRYLQEYIRTHKRGQLFGLVISLVVVASAFYLAMAGKIVSAGVLSLSGFGALAFASLASAIDRKFQHKPRYYALQNNGNGNGNNHGEQQPHNRRADD